MNSKDHINEITLEYRQWRSSVRETIPQGMGKESAFQLRAKMFDFCTQLGVAASMQILTETIGEHEFPMNWIEAFRERWFPGWILKRYPIKYNKIDVDAIYPSMPGEMPILKERYLGAEVREVTKRMGVDI